MRIWREDAFSIRRIQLWEKRENDKATDVQTNCSTTSTSTIEKHHLGRLGLRSRRLGLGRCPCFPAITDLFNRRHPSAAVVVSLSTAVKTMRVLFLLFSSTHGSFPLLLPCRTKSFPIYLFIYLFIEFFFLVIVVVFLSVSWFGPHLNMPNGHCFSDWHDDNQKQKRNKRQIVAATRSRMFKSRDNWASISSGYQWITILWFVFFPSFLVFWFLVSADVNDAQQDER